MCGRSIVSANLLSRLSLQYAFCVHYKNGIPYNHVSLEVNS